MTTRRIVTGTNVDGKSYIVQDGSTPTRIKLGPHVFDEIWVDDPANPTSLADIPFHLEPPIDGSLIRLVTFYPESRDIPWIHTTRTIDYGIVLSGEINLELDEGKVHLKSGDVVVQRGTGHGWYNPGPKPCTIAFIMISSSNFQTMSNQKCVRRECIGCRQVHPLTYFHKCAGCGRILCLACIDKEKFQCSKCNGQFTSKC